MGNIEVAAFRKLLQVELPRLLREHPESRHEIWGLMLESFPSRQEFTTLQQELHDFREDTTRRFESLEAQATSFGESGSGEGRGERCFKP